MKKLLAILLTLAMVSVLVAACNGTSGNGGNGGNGSGDELTDIKIALVAHSPGSIQFDGSFNEGAWNGIVDFLNKRNLNPREQANFFQAHDDTDEARVDIITDAINWGADILILPGWHFAMSVGTAQDLFPATKFVILDARPNFVGPEAANTVSIVYSEEQSGFLAGYALVKDGFRDLGFMGGTAVPAVVRFGHGFIEGAAYAANDLGLADGAVSINYHYIGDFQPNPAVTTMAASWYASGTEVIFSAAGGAGFSVIEASEAADTFVVGVDVDQANDSPTVITSAMKALAISVDDMLTDFVNDNFQGGRNLMYNAANRGIGLPMATSRFRTFSLDDYNAILAKLVDGSITVSTVLPEDDGTTNPNDLINVGSVTVTFIN
ncbi:MAG: BMP family ABC transporter substrate-binding protein [Oscillospiraceae bacterium]|nr:BMP family ABC transporter substrate-binding protein [Oscillospiraceae bacterium]